MEDITLQALEQRVPDPQIPARFAEDPAQQPTVVRVRPPAQLDRLIRELVELRDRALAEPSAPRTLRDELPPHY